MVEVQEANNLAVYLLNEMGYAGTTRDVKVNKVVYIKPVTVPHSKEQLLLLADAATHSGEFFGHWWQPCYDW